MWITLPEDVFPIDDDDEVMSVAMNIKHEDTPLLKYFWGNSDSCGHLELFITRDGNWVSLFCENYDITNLFTGPDGQAHYPPEDHLREYVYSRFEEIIQTWPIIPELRIPIGWDSDWISYELILKNNTWEWSIGGFNTLTECEEMKKAVIKFRGISDDEEFKINIYDEYGRIECQQ